MNRCQRYVGQRRKVRCGAESRSFPGIVVGVALSGVGAALNRSGTIDVRRGMALNPISARRAVVAAAVAMRRRISDLPATGVGSAVAVAYWTSVMHGRFGVREVAGGWPG
jgi:hypothetical protein